MEWLVLALLCLLATWYIHRDLKLQQLTDLEELRRRLKK